jgi:hypothetical protein
MVQHVLHGLLQLPGNGFVELSAGILERPLVVAHHPLGANEPQPEREPKQFYQTSGHELLDSTAEDPDQVGSGPMNYREFY